MESKAVNQRGNKLQISLTLDLNTMNPKQIETFVEFILGFTSPYFIPSADESSEHAAELTPIVKYPCIDAECNNLTVEPYTYCSECPRVRQPPVVTIDMYDDIPF